MNVERPGGLRRRVPDFRLIREAEYAAKRLTNAPMYLHGGYDEDGDVIAIENICPYDDFDDAIRAIEENETAVSILVAQGRTEIGGTRLKGVIRALRHADIGPSRDDMSGSR